jgi:hypothetical protein
MNHFYEPKSRESIFIGDPETLKTYVANELRGNFNPLDIPDTPRGLVLSDMRGTGAFQ